MQDYATTEYVDSLDISDQLTNYATKADLENIELTEAQKAELKGEPGQSVQVWKGTGNEYFELQSNDPNTIYLIKEG
ncbi:hypothetical protein ACWOBX_08385 [Facklamia languida]